MRHVICFGNPLHGDDGFGPAVGQRLQQRRHLPSDVRVFEAGTRGLDALLLFENCREAIIVDAMRPGKHPGRVTQPAAECLAQEARHAGHGSGVGFLLAALAASGLPRPRIVAAEAAALNPFTPELSPAMQQAVDVATGLLCRMLDANDD